MLLALLGVIFYDASRVSITAEYLVKGIRMENSNQQKLQYGDTKHLELFTCTKNYTGLFRRALLGELQV